MDDNGEDQDISGVGTIIISANHNADLSLANETLMTSHLKDSSYKVKSFIVTRAAKLRKWLQYRQDEEQRFHRPGRYVGTKDGRYTLQKLSSNKCMCCGSPMYFITKASWF